MRFTTILNVWSWVIFSSLVLSGAFGGVARADASPDDAPMTATVKLQNSQVSAGGTVDVLIDMKLADNYHAYLDRFKLALEGPDDVKLDQFKISPVVQFMDSFSKKMKEGVEHGAQMKTVAEVPAGFAAGAHSLALNLTYQACTTDHCLFPKHILLKVPFTVVARVGGGPGTPNKAAGETKQVVAAPGAQDDFGRALGKGTFFALFVVFGMGFLTSLTPCIYPMIPITLAVLGARTKGQSKTKSFALSFTYVLGIALTYAILGVIAASTGSLFGAALSNIYVVSGIALLFVAMSLSMYGVYELQVPAFLRDSVGTAKTGSGFGGAFATGLIAGVVASPCVGPVLVSILTYIAQTQNLVQGFLFLFSFAMGMGILFMVLGTSSSLLGKLPKAGGWMDTVKFVFGTVMIGMALYYIHPLYPAWLFQLLTGVAAILIASAYGAFEPNESLTTSGRLRKGAMLAAFAIGVVFALMGALDKAGLSFAPSPGLNANNGAGTEQKQDFAKLNWQPYSESALQDAIKAGRPVLIDFFAEWCEACHKLERYTFVDPRIQEISQKYTLLKVDATEPTELLKELQTRHRVMGLPTMVFYDNTGKTRDDLRVTGFEEADTFLGRMKTALGTGSGQTADGREPSNSH